MTRADLALAAARTRLLAERLDDQARDDLIAEWSAMNEALEESIRPVNADLILTTYRAEVERRLAQLSPPSPQ